MGGKLVKSEATYSFSFHGENQIDAELLSAAIHNFAEITKETVNSDVPEAYIKLNVTAFRQGSFIIDFSTVCELSNILSGLPQAVNLAKNVVDTIKGYFDIKKFLKGQKPQTIEKVSGSQIKIENTEGDVFYAPDRSIKVLENSKIDTLIVNICKDAETHGKSSFSFKVGSDESVYNSEDISAIKEPIPMESEQIVTIKKSVVKTVLPIKKPDILGKSAWDFRYEDRSIRASIEDEDWIEKVRSGCVSFKCGDALCVLLEIIVELDENACPIDGSDKYVVKQVLEHISDADQTTLF